MTNTQSSFGGWLAISIGIIISTAIAAQSWVGVRLHCARSLDVTGSAKRRIVSDLIEWNAIIQTEDKDRTAAYKALHEHVSSTHAYLKKQGITDAELRIHSVATEEIFDTEYEGKGDSRIERHVNKRFRTTQSIDVSSKDVPKIDRVAREVTELMEGGVPITSDPASFYYTQLGALKIEMLAEAAKDCCTRAERILQSTGGATLGKLRRADK